MNVILFMLILCVISACNLFLQKKFQLRTAENVLNFAFYNLINAFLACVYFLIASGFNVDINMKTYLFSVGYAMIVCVSLVLSVCMLSRTQISTSTIVASSGNIVISTVFGIVYFGEILSISLFAAIVLVMLGVLLSVKSSGDESTSEGNRYVKLLICILFFVNSGAANVVSKLYVETPGVCGSVSFFFFTNLNLLMVSMVVIAVYIIKQKAKPGVLLRCFTFGQILNIGARTALSNVSSVITVVVLSMMDISLYTIIVSSLGIILAALMSLFFREKMRLSNWIAVVFVVTAIVMINI